MTVNGVDLDELEHTMREFQYAVHCNASEKGFWDNPPEVGTSIALMHAELSEALEADRDNGFKSMDKHLPTHPGVAVEMADVIIRILDFAEHHNLPVIDAMIEKAKFNESRPVKHGKRY